MRKMKNKIQQKLYNCLSICAVHLDLPADPDALIYYLILPLIINYFFNIHFIIVTIKAAG